MTNNGNGLSLYYFEIEYDPETYDFHIGVAEKIGDFDTYHCYHKTVFYLFGLDGDFFYNGDRKSFSNKVAKGSKIGVLVDMF